MLLRDTTSKANEQSYFSSSALRHPESITFITLNQHNPERIGALVKELIDFDSEIIVEIPMNLSKSLKEHGRRNEDQWSIWNKFYEATGYYKHLKVDFTFK